MSYTAPMVQIQNITVVNEANHRVQFDVGVDAAEDRTYEMQIRDVPASTDTADATFTGVGQGRLVTCVGDCSNLQPGTRYFFDLVEDGSVIVTGTVQVIQRVTK